MYLQNGEHLHVHRGDCWDVTYHLNSKNKSKAGVDYFIFIRCPSAGAASCRVNSRRLTTYWCSGYWGAEGTRPTNRETIKQKCNNTQKLVYCQYLLEMDNWNFKEDNPWIFNKTKTK